MAGRSGLGTRRVGFVDGKSRRASPLSVRHFSTDVPISGFDAQTGKGTISDVLDFSAILGPTYSVQALSGASANVNSDAIGWLYNSASNQTLVYVNPTAGA